MAIRFRRSIKLAPGVRWNLTGSGSSWTFGPRGASIGVGKRGARLNSSMLGFSSSKPLSSPRRQAAAPAPMKTVSLTCGLHEDGTLYFTDASGSPVAEEVVEIAKKQNKEAILGLIQRKCDEINEQIEALGRLHHDTPDPRVKPKFVAPHFDEPQPVMEKPRVPGLLDKLFASRKRLIEDANGAADARYREAMDEWKRKKAAFDKEAAKRKVFIESLIYDDLASMEAFLEENLQDIVWPRETLVAFDIVDGGRRVLVDIDLPELEDMPTKMAAVPARGLKLSIKELSAAKVQKLYAEHVHGILFRIIGETFAALPAVQTVVASGYSQRRDPATAQLSDEYLLSVRVERGPWTAADFAHLSALDVTEALSRFDLRRDMLKSGKLKRIEPFAG
jgi:hypothetical protein